MLLNIEKRRILKDKKLDLTGLITTLITYLIITYLIITYYLSIGWQDPLEKMKKQIWATYYVLKACNYLSFFVVNFCLFQEISYM